MIDPKCPTCKGNGWVCENHPDVPWGGEADECCGGAGMPCSCNPGADALPGSIEIWSAARGWRQ